MPWDMLFPRQQQLFNAATEEECLRNHPNAPAVILVDGGRQSSKSIGVANRVIRHMWETEGARVALVVKILSSATDGGAFNDIMEIVLPWWFDAKIGCKFTTRNNKGSYGPITDSQTRTIYFRITNFFGGESELRLFSLHNDSDVEAKFKTTRFSCFWFSELGNFKDPHVLRTTWNQLRMFHLPKHRHLWIADANPPEEGEDCWFYQLFYNRRFEVAGIDKKVADGMTDGAKQFSKSLQLFHFNIEDNLSMNQTDREVQRSLYAEDPGALARDYEGRYVKGHGNKGKHFADIFSPYQHVIGGQEGEQDQIALSPDTTMLYTSWDIGGSVNHAATILEKRPFITPQGLKFSMWNVIDEVVYVHEQKRVADLGREVLAKMDGLDALYKKKFEWVHYADDTALTVWRASSGTYDYIELQLATNGRINLSGVPKPHDSIQARVHLLRRLIMEMRFYVSYRCKNVVDMMGRARRGETKADYFSPVEVKHIFDAVTYAPFMVDHSDLLLEATRPNALAGRIEPVRIRF